MWLGMDRARERGHWRFRVPRIGARRSWCVLFRRNRSCISPATRCPFHSLFLPFIHVLIILNVQAPIDHDSYTSLSRITTTTSRFLRTKTIILPWGPPGPRRRFTFRTECTLKRALLRVSRTTPSLRTHIESKFPQPMP